MPLAALRACACGALVRGQCTACAKRRNAGRRAKGMYDSEYQRNRAIVLREEDNCALCGGLGMEDDTADHITPLAKGGTHDRWNLRRAHKSCNSARGARGME